MPNLIITGKFYANKPYSLNASFLYPTFTLFVLQYFKKKVNSEKNQSSIKTIKSRPTRTTTGMSEKKEGKEMRDIKMGVRRMSVNKNNAKKTFVTNALDNHISETHVTGA